MATIANLMVKINGDASGLNAAMDNANKTMGAFTKVAAAAALAVGAGMVAGLKSGIDGIMEYENATSQLDAVLSSTGGTAGVTKESITDMASAFQLTTKFSEEATIGAANMLLTFTNISSETFPAATKAALDMATVFGGDAASQSIALGKALNNPTAGITALTRVGVTFTEGQKTAIKAMQDAGDMAGAQAIILAELEKEFGGSAEAAGGTFAGQITIAKNAVGEIWESVATSLMPALQGFLTWVQDNMPQIKSTIETTADNIFKAINTVVEVFKTAYDWVIKYKDILIPLVGGIAAGVIAFNLIRTAILLWSAAGSIATIVTTTLSTAFLLLTSPVGLVVAAIALLTAGAILLWQNWDKVTSAVGKAIDALKEWLGIKTPTKNIVVNTTQNESKRRSEYASGTNYAAGGLSLVGERGPELVDMPRGAKVYTANETKGMLGSSGKSVTNYFNFDNVHIFDKGDQKTTLMQLDFMGALA